MTCFPLQITLAGPGRHERFQVAGQIAYDAQCVGPAPRKDCGAATSSLRILDIVESKNAAQRGAPAVFLVVAPFLEALFLR